MGCRISPSAVRCASKKPRSRFVPPLQGGDQGPALEAPVQDTAVLIAQRRQRLCRRSPGLSKIVLRQQIGGEIGERHAQRDFRAARRQPHGCGQAVLDGFADIAGAEFELGQADQDHARPRQAAGWLRQADGVMIVLPRHHHVVLQIGKEAQTLENPAACYVEIAAGQQLFRFIQGALRFIEATELAVIGADPGQDRAKVQPVAQLPIERGGLFEQRKGSLAAAGAFQCTRPAP